MRLVSYLVLATSLLTLPLRATVRWVAPAGSPNNDGTFARPWDLQTGLADADAGDTVWLRGGTYHGSFTCWANGRPGAPITYRQYPGEIARIDMGSSRNPGITMQCHDVWLWGFEIFSSNPNRISVNAGSFPEDIERGQGIVTAQVAGIPANLRFINLVIHDTWGAFGIWKEAANAEIYGNIIFYDGWDGPDRGHGHGIYSQNDGATPHYIEDNIIFSEFSHGVHVFSSDDLLQNFWVQGNIAFDNGAPSKTTSYATNYRIGAGQSIPKKVTFAENIGYFSPRLAGGDSQLGSPTGCRQLTVLKNLLIATNGISLIKPPACTDLTFDNNTLIGAVQGFEQNSYSFQNSLGGETQVFIRPNRYEAGRAHIVVINPKGSDIVELDLSSVLRPGSTFEIRDVQDLFGATVAGGQYSGQRVPVPMNRTGVTPLVGNAPVPRVHTDRMFGVFLLTSTGPPVVRSPGKNSRGNGR